MVRTHDVRRLFVRPATPMSAVKAAVCLHTPADASESAPDGLTLYCQAQSGFARRLMGAQTAQDILRAGFEDKHYRFHAKLNGWVAATEWIEGDGVYLTDRPLDPAGVMGVQVEVIVTFTEKEPDAYEMVRSHTIGIDYTGASYRRNREFLIPAHVLNESIRNGRCRLRILLPEEAFEKCSFRIAEAEERAQQIAQLSAA